MDSTPYPAQHQPRLAEVLMAIRAAQRTGEFPLDLVALTLLQCVATEEHALGYARVPLFNPGQLCCRLGIKQPETVYKARRRAIDAGWLHYEHRGNHPAAYWVLIPPMFHGARPTMFDEPDRVQQAHQTSPVDEPDHAERAGRPTLPNVVGDAPTPPNGLVKHGQPCGPTMPNRVHGEGVGDGASESEPEREKQQPLLPREVMDRLEPLRSPELGLDLDADLPGWVRETDGLDAEHVRQVLALRHRVELHVGERVVQLRWPSHFAVLRDAWAKARAEEHRRRMRDELAAKRAAMLAQEPPPPAVYGPLPPAELDGSLITRWSEIVAACRPVNPLDEHAMRSWSTWLASPKVRPLGAAGGVLWLHVPDKMFDCTLRDRFTHVLAAAASEMLGHPIRKVACQINGHAHPMAAALPGVAVAVSS